MSSDLDVPRAEIIGLISQYLRDEGYAATLVAFEKECASLHHATNSNPSKKYINLLELVKEYLSLKRDNVKREEFKKTFVMQSPQNQRYVETVLENVHQLLDLFKTKIDSANQTASNANLLSISSLLMATPPVLIPSSLSLFPPTTFLPAANGQMKRLPPRKPEPMHSKPPVNAAAAAFYPTPGSSLSAPSQAAMATGSNMGNTPRNPTPPNAPHNASAPSVATAKQTSMY